MLAFRIRVLMNDKYQHHYSDIIIRFSIQFLLLSCGLCATDLTIFIQKKRRYSQSICTVRYTIYKLYGRIVYTTRYI